MRKLITLCILLGSLLFANAQSPGIQWQKSFGGSSEELAFSTHQTTDGGYIVAGRSFSTDADVNGNHGGYDCWIVKLNNMGETTIPAVKK